MTHLRGRSFEKWLLSLCSEIWLRCMLWQRCMLCKIEFFFFFFVFICFIANNSEISKMLFFEQNNAFNQTQFWKVGVVSFKICVLKQRSFVWKIGNEFHSIILLSLLIFDYSKIAKCCFLTRIITLSRHTLKQWAW